MNPKDIITKGMTVSKLKKAGKGYHSPHKGLPNVHGGSMPRGNRVGLLEEKDMSAYDNSSEEVLRNTKKLRSKYPVLADVERSAIKLGHKLWDKERFAWTPAGETDIGVESPRERLTFRMENEGKEYEDEMKEDLLHDMETPFVYNTRTGKSEHLGQGIGYNKLNAVISREAKRGNIVGALDPEAITIFRPNRKKR